MKKINKPLKIEISSLVGTTFMTLFSYLFSVLEEENFIEPEYLKVMFKRLAPRYMKILSKVSGWGAHYAVGMFFALVYQELWDKGKIKKTLKNGLFLGALSGAAGILIWKGSFKAHPSPPKTNYFKYFMQLIPAHMVFAVFATLTNQLFDQLEERAAKNLNQSRLHLA